MAAESVLEYVPELSDSVMAEFISRLASSFLVRDGGVTQEEGGSTLVLTSETSDVRGEACVEAGGILVAGDDVMRAVALPIIAHLVAQNSSISIDAERFGEEVERDDFEDLDELRDHVWDEIGLDDDMRTQATEMWQLAYGQLFATEG